VGVMLSESDCKRIYVYCMLRLAELSESHM
jgi:hypothetical protein